MDDPLPPLPNQPAKPALPRRRRPAPPSTNGWKILAILLMMVLFISFFGGISSFLSGFFGGQGGVPLAEEGLEEVLIKQNGSSHKIAVIDVLGIISEEPDASLGFSMVDLVRKSFDQAAEDPNVKAVVLKIDSPGGEVLAADEIAHVIQRFQDRAKKPVIAAMGATAASGGYYVAAPCQWIVANELTLTGSIGVLMYGYNFRGLMDKLGVQPEVYTSGKLKTMMSSTKKPEEITVEERQLVQNLVDETFHKFKSVVEEGRRTATIKNPKEGRPLKPDWHSIADGRILSGKQAYEYGLVDEMGNLESALRRARNIAGIANANLIRYQPPFHFTSLFRLFGKSETPAIKVDLGLTPPKIQGGRLYFLPATLLK